MFPLSALDSCICTKSVVLWLLWGMWAPLSWAQMFSCTPPSPCLWQRIYRETTLHHVHTRHTLSGHFMLRTRFSKEIPPIASWDIHVPCHNSSVKTPQPSDLSCTRDRKDKVCLGLPHNMLPVAESWERGQKWMKYVPLSWSGKTSQDSSTAHQSGVDLLKYLLLVHWWTCEQHRP